MLLYILTISAPLFLNLLIYSQNFQVMLYVKDYLDDVDGSSTRAFDELFAGLNAKGIGIDWEDML